MYVLEYCQISFILCMFVQLCMRMCIHECSCPQKPEEGATAHGAEITDGCKPPNIDFKKLIQVLCKSSVHT